MRRSKRFSFLAGWAAVALLAAAGFAAFANPTPDPEEVIARAQASSIGHSTGAYAGLAFSNPGEVRISRPPENDGDTFSVGAPAGDQVTSDRDADEPPTVTARSTESVGWLSEVEVRALASLYFDPEDVSRAVRVAWCESRFDPSATSISTGAVGLFQHLPRYWDERAANAGFPGSPPTDAEASTAAAAWAIYESGWNIFSCRG